MADTPGARTFSSSHDTETQDTREVKTRDTEAASIPVWEIQGQMKTPGETFPVACVDSSAVFCPLCRARKNENLIIICSSDSS